MIEAIIFDCFDVLVTNGLPLYYSKYLKNNPDKISLIEKQVEALNKGVISYDSFIEKTYISSELIPQTLNILLSITSFLFSSL